jgi:hypothetical protein
MTIPKSKENQITEFSSLLYTQIHPVIFLGIPPDINILDFALRFFLQKSMNSHSHL